MRQDLPEQITAIEAAAAFERLAAFDHLILAVSGGPDSMALMLLVAQWRAGRAGGPVVSVASVDHALRPTSRHEAEMVAAAAGELGLPHVILTWTGLKPSVGVPAAAREARYRLLEQHARTLLGSRGERIAVATAHHRDDQVETFAMRLARGAGVDGLAGMPSERPLSEGSPIALVRPLLAFPKARLIATLAARGVDAVQDPTNIDLRFERARLRSHLAKLEAAGLSSKAIAASARRLGDARDALSYAEDVFVSSLGLSFGHEVFACLERQAFKSGPALLRQRVIERLVRRYGGDTPAAQLSEIEDLVARMQRDVSSTATLGGAMISTGPRFIRVWRELGRLTGLETRLFRGEARVWDGRFRLRFSLDTVSAGGIDFVTVRPLGERGYAMIAPRLLSSRRPPARAARAVPSFWAGEEFIAAPALAPFARLDAPRLDPEGMTALPLHAAEN